MKIRSELGEPMVVRAHKPKTQTAAVSSTER